MRFSSTNHQTWHTLFTRQLPHVELWACSLFKEGLQLLNLPESKIPTISHLNSHITPHTGWTITRTPIRYMTHKEWFTALSNRQFPITGYIRGQNELDFTPEPDIFHDIFGHQPFMVHPEYAEIFDLFAIGYKKIKTDDQKRALGRLAWFGYEFGLIEEQNSLKAFGAGLLSSFSEIQNISASIIPKKPFTVENVIQGKKPDGTRKGDEVYGVTKNSELFVIKSLNHLKSEIRRYIGTL